MNQGRLEQVRSCVTISLVSKARGGPFVFWGDLREACEQASNLGFDAVEIFASAPSDLQAAQLRKWLDELGLQLAAVGTGAGWLLHGLTLTNQDASIRRRARQFIKELSDVGAAFNAPAIIGSMQGRFGDGTTREGAWVVLQESLDELAEHAAQYHVPLLFEPLNRYETNLVNTMSDAVDMLSKLRTSNVRILADLFHMGIEEVNVADAVRHAGRVLGHVHFVDSNRRAAGMGHTDFRPIAKALQDMDYRGYLSAEALPLPDSETAARETVRAFQRWFRTESAHNERSTQNATGSTGQE